ncbi:MAG: cupin domain-containing protein [Janthinobacterium lividum]
MPAVLTAAPDFGAVRDVDELVRLIGAQNCTPGWIPRKSPLFWPRPKSAFVPAHWKYAEIRPGLLAAGRVIDTELAERRNFVLRNPIPDNDFATTRTLVGAYQSILPGEKARSHRHSAHALRVIIESRGSYSVVNGKRHPMETGDIVLTPGGHWHGHGHDGSEQAFWFDCLDLPLVHLLEPMWIEEHPAHWEAPTSIENESPMRLTWADTCQRLEKAGDGDVHFGKTIDLSSPAMPTITIKVHRWQAGWRNQPFIHNANTIYVVLQGRGTSSIGDQQFAWALGDVIAAPIGVRVAHTVDESAVLVALTDEGLMRHCGYYGLQACD